MPPYLPAFPPVCAKGSDSDIAAIGQNLPLCTLTRAAEAALFFVYFIFLVLPFISKRILQINAFLYHRTKKQYIVQNRIDNN